MSQPEKMTLKTAKETVWTWLGHAVSTEISTEYVLATGYIQGHADGFKEGYCEGNRDSRQVLQDIRDEFGDRTHFSKYTHSSFEKAEERIRSLKPPQPLGDTKK